MHRVPEYMEHVPYIPEHFRQNVPLSQANQCGFSRVKYGTSEEGALWEVESAHAKHVCKLGFFHPFALHAVAIRVLYHSTSSHLVCRTSLLGLACRITYDIRYTTYYTNYTYTPENSRILPHTSKVYVYDSRRYDYTIPRAAMARNIRFIRICTNS
jgi:hypothetical protein